jgi:hypothetical protein
MAAMMIASVVKLIIRESSRSSRLNAALKDSQPDQRPEIIRAAGEFEQRAQQGKDKTPGVGLDPVSQRVDLIGGGDLRRTRRTDKR